VSSSPLQRSLAQLTLVCVRIVLADDATALGAIWTCLGCCPKLEQLDVSGPFPHDHAHNAHLAAAAAAHDNLPRVGDDDAVLAAVACNRAQAWCSTDAASGCKGAILYLRLRQLNASAAAAVVPLLVRLFVPETRSVARMLTHLLLRVRL
jgi:hypothetical protein